MLLSDLVLPQTACSSHSCLKRHVSRSDGRILTEKPLMVVAGRDTLRGSCMSFLSKDLNVSRRRSIRTAGTPAGAAYQLIWKWKANRAAWSFVETSKDVQEVVDCCYNRRCGLGTLCRWRSMQTSGTPAGAACWPSWPGTPAEQPGALWRQARMCGRLLNAAITGDELGPLCRSRSMQTAGIPAGAACRPSWPGTPAEQPGALWRRARMCGRMQARCWGK